MKVEKPVNIVIVGVGGQGIITMASVLAGAAVAKGYNAIVAETHGMSQRGGTVIVHVRLGAAEAPLIMRGDADLLIALEAVEALRYSDYLPKGGIAIVDSRLIRPPLPNVEMPELNAIVSALRGAGLRVYQTNAVDRAESFGIPQGANMYLLGYGLAVQGYKGYVDMESLKTSIMERVRKPEANIKVLEAGYRDGLKATGKAVL